MEQTFMHMLKGYLAVRMRGYTPERFFNLCRANCVEIWDICCRGECHEFKVSLQDYRRVRPLVKKSHVHLDIIGKRGLPFFLYRNRRRKLYVAGLLAFFLILFSMTHFIWDISIDGNYRFTDDMLLHYLGSQGITCGMRKRDVDCTLLEDELRGAYQEILWVSARISGTRLLIRIKENDVIGEIVPEDKTPGNLVAEKSGTITRMVVRSGKPQVKAGDKVEKGQLLVSGEIPIYDDSETLIDSHRVRAEADIYALTEAVYKEDFSKITEERQNTGRTRYGLEIQAGGQSLLWLLPAWEDTLWKITVKKRQMTLFGDFYLPVWVNQVTAREYVKYSRSLKKEELEEKKNQFCKRIEGNLIQKGVEIIENDVTIIDMEGSCQIRGNYILEEPIGQYQELMQIKGEEPPG